jgi:hypothetical protein
MCSARPREASMNPNPRAGIAYIAGCLISKTTASSLYDQSQDRHISMSGTFGYDSVEVLDHDAGCHIVGMKNGAELSLYHSGDEHKMSLKINGNQFTGHDFGSNCSFNGTVDGNAVRIYDYGQGSYFSYTIA